MRPVTVLGLSLLACGLTGCGTVRNFYPQEPGEVPLEVYGGVKRSVASLKETAGHDVGAALLVVIWPIPVGDIVLSAVGDTVTLPVTTAAAVYRRFVTWSASTNTTAKPTPSDSPRE